MRIGIFGDSFAADDRPHSWVSLLSNDYSVDQYAFGGTSLFHCYQTMLKCNTLVYDVIIVAVTNAGRLYTGYDVDKDKPYLSGIETALYHKKSADRSEIDRIDAGIAYYLNLSNDEYNQYVHEKITQDIIDMMHLGCTLVLLPSFEHSYSPTLRDYASGLAEENFSLFNVTQMEKQSLGVKPGESEKFTLYNHMCEENNVVLYNWIKSGLDSTNMKLTKLSLSNFTQPAQSKDYYYG